MKLVIQNLKCSSVNEIYNLHHFARSERKRKVQQLVYYEALKTKRHRLEKCRLIFTAYFKGKRKHDPDNLYVKPMIDALILAGIIEDDNSNIVQSVTLQCVTEAEEEKVVIEIL